MRVLLMLAVAMILTGCAAPGPAKFRAATTEGQVRLDKATKDCQYELALAVRAPVNVPVGHWLAESDMKHERDKLMRGCMLKKGWDLPAEYDRYL